MLGSSREFLAFSKCEENWVMNQENKSISFYKCFVLMEKDAKQNLDLNCQLGGRGLKFILYPTKVLGFVHMIYPNLSHNVHIFVYGFPANWNGNDHHQPAAQPL